MEESLRFKIDFSIDWASLIDGKKFAVFALFYFVFEGNFQVQVQAPGKRKVFWVTRLGGLYLEGLIFGILRYVNMSTLAKQLRKNWTSYNTNWKLLHCETTTSSNICRIKCMQSLELKINLEELIETKGNNNGIKKFEWDLSVVFSHSFDSLFWMFCFLLAMVKKKE